MQTPHLWWTSRSSCFLGSPYISRYSTTLFLCTPRRCLVRPERLIAWSHSQQNVFTESSILLLYILFANTLAFFVVDAGADVVLVSLAHILMVVDASAVRDLMRPGQTCEPFIPSPKEVQPDLPLLHPIICATKSVVHDFASSSRRSKLVSQNSSSVCLLVPSPQYLPSPTCLGSSHLPQAPGQPLCDFSSQLICGPHLQLASCSLTWPARKEVAKGKTDWNLLELF